MLECFFMVKKYLSCCHFYYSNAAHFLALKTYSIFVILMAKLGFIFLYRLLLKSVEVTCPVIYVRVHIYLP